MTTDPAEDAYRVLQVDPTAHQVVIRAAYMALARRYHPDGEAPDPVRMAALSRAYDQVRDEARRRMYDARRSVFGTQRTTSATPVGPGPDPGAGATRPEAAVGAGFAEAPWDRAATQAPPTTAPPQPSGTFSRSRAARTAEAAASAQLDFGRYTGWTLRDLARHDPDYLRWLSRHSSGIRFRAEILRLLPEDHDLGNERRGGRY